MDLVKTSNSDLILNLKKLVHSERKITHLVLQHIIEVEKRKLDLDLGFYRMFSYLTKELGYSEHAAYERLRAAELLKQLPEVSEKIESGALNLSQLTEVQKCLKEKAQKGQAVTPEQTREALSAIEYQTGFQTQKYLAQEFDLPMQQHETLKPQKDESIRLEITLTKEEFAELQMAKELLSHVCPDGKWSDVISELAKRFNTLKMGKRAAGTETKKNDRATTSTPRLMQSPLKRPQLRPYISVKVKRALLEKAGHTCEFVDHKTGNRCSARHQLQIDHIQPLALAGGHEIGNLRILCAAHNRHQALKSGLGKSTATAGFR